MRSIALLSVLSFVVLSSWSCAAGNSSACDPDTITVNGRCFWEKNQACDAASCVPPDQCVVHETKPATVECKKAQKSE